MMTYSTAVPGLALAVMVALTACGRTLDESDRQSPEKQLEIQTEVLHQTREVIRYVDAQQELEQEQLNSLQSVPAQ
jgi:hypothetical protein